MDRDEMLWCWAEAHASRCGCEEPGDVACEWPVPAAHTKDGARKVWLVPELEH
jgi:hypothetical protein